MESCQTCRWFDRVDGNTGLCRFEPPTVIPAQMETNSKAKTKPFTAWPLVRNLDWCGEHDDRT